jgi:phosphoserine aminotransferase
MDYLRRELIVPEVYNFSPGPCTLPRSVIEQASYDLITWDVSAAEMSHRSVDFNRIAT